MKWLQEKILIAWRKKKIEIMDHDILKYIM